MYLQARRTPVQVGHGVLITFEDALLKIRQAIIIACMSSISTSFYCPVLVLYVAFSEDGGSSSIRQLRVLHCMYNEWTLCSQTFFQYNGQICKTVDHVLLLLNCKSCIRVCHNCSFMQTSVPLSTIGHLVGKELHLNLHF